MIILCLLVWLWCFYVLGAFLYMLSEEEKLIKEGYNLERNDRYNLLSI